MNHKGTKLCIYCKRPFTRRKKRERCRDEVKFCSERCKREYKTKQQSIVNNISGSN